jgi:hypothetical protein
MLSCIACNTLFGALAKSSCRAAGSCNARCMEAHSLACVFNTSSMITACSAVECDGVSRRRHQETQLLTLGSQLPTCLSCSASSGNARHSTHRSACAWLCSGICKHTQCCSNSMGGTIVNGICSATRSRRLPAEPSNVHAASRNSMRFSTPQVGHSTCGMAAGGMQRMPQEQLAQRAGKHKWLLCFPMQQKEPHLRCQQRERLTQGDNHRHCIRVSPRSLCYNLQ